MTFYLNINVIYFADEKNMTNRFMAMIGLKTTDTSLDIRQLSKKVAELADSKDYPVQDVNAEMEEGAPFIRCNNVTMALL